MFFLRILGKVGRIFHNEISINIGFSSCFSRPSYSREADICMKDILAILMLDDDSRGAGHSHRPSIHDIVTRRDYDCLGGFHEGLPTVFVIVFHGSSDCFSLWAAAYTRRSHKTF